MTHANRFIFSLLAFLFWGASMAAAADAKQDVEAALNQLHERAAKADGAGYFELFADDGVFIGTDAAERWTVAEFKKYAMERFSKGKGWTYVPRERHVDFSPDGSVAWFDEILDNKTYGTCRGTGVLRRVGGAWKISQYHLTIPVPNALATDVVGMIRKQGVTKK